MVNLNCVFQPTSLFKSSAVAQTVFGGQTTHPQVANFPEHVPEIMGTGWQ